MFKVGDRVRVKDHKHPEYIGQETVIQEITPNGCVVRLKPNYTITPVVELWGLLPHCLELISPAESPQPIGEEVEPDPRPFD